jgi:hypothetical protein
MSVDQQYAFTRHKVGEELTWSYPNYSIVGKPKVIQTNQMSNTLKKYLSKYSFEAEDLNKSNTEEETPLTKAVSLRLKETVRELLLCELDVNLCGKTDIELGDHENSEGLMTPLEIACFKGYDEIVEMLVAHHDIELGAYSTEPLPIALANYGGHKKVVDILIAAGENPANGLPPSLSHLQELVHFVFTSLQHAFLTAEKTSKKLLVIMGEEHKAWRSFLLNEIIISCVKKLGIKDVMLECNEERLKFRHEYQVMKEFEEYRLKYDTDNAQMQNFLSSMNVIPVDTFKPADFNAKLNLDTQHQIQEIMSTPENMEARNKTMLGNIDRVKKHALLLIGAAHFKGLIEDHTPDLKVYHVINFDTTSTVCFGLLKTDEIEEDLLFPFISEKVIKLKLVGNLLGYTLTRANQEIKAAINGYFSLKPEGNNDKASFLKKTLDSFVDPNSESEGRISTCISDYLYPNSEIVIDTIPREKIKARIF